jgi:hypothetical protein
MAAPRRNDAHVHHVCFAPTVIGCARVIRDKLGVRSRE